MIYFPTLRVRKSNEKISFVNFIHLVSRKIGCSFFSDLFESIKVSILEIKINSDTGNTRNKLYQKSKNKTTLPEDKNSFIICTFVVSTVDVHCRCARHLSRFRMRKMRLTA